MLAHISTIWPIKATVLARPGLFMIISLAWSISKLTPLILPWNHEIGWNWVIATHRMSQSATCKFPGEFFLLYFSITAQTLWIWKTRGSIVKASPGQVDSASTASFSFGTTIENPIKSHQWVSLPKNILTWDFHPFPLSVPSQKNQACSKYLQLRPLTTDRWTTKWFWQVMRHHLETNLVLSLRLKHIEVVSVSWNLLFPKTNM